MRELTFQVLREKSEEKPEPLTTMGTVLVTVLPSYHVVFLGTASEWKIYVNEGPSRFNEW